MGYTQYFHRRPGADPAAFAALTRDAWRLFAHCEAQGIALAGGLGEGAPETTSKRIAFNGAAPEDYETMEWLAAPRQWNPYAKPGALVFGFCKTAQRPYDVAVVAFLLLAQSHYGDAVKLSSDGDAPELAPALALLAEAFPGRELSLAPFLGACVA
jgi:hypothetical protein